MVLAVIDQGDRAGTVDERHAVIAERIARVRAGDARLLSVDEVERSIREHLDI